MSESSASLLARLIHQGGKILVIGGEVKDLPRPYHEHPALLLWDDNQQNILHKDVPSNVRAILWNRWISHAVRDRLNVAAEKLRIVKFPNLRSREIKSLLAEIVHEHKEVTDTEIVSEPQPEQPTQSDLALRAESSNERGDSDMAKNNMKGFLKPFIVKNIRLDSVDWSVRGAVAKEGNRLYEKAKADGVKTTQGSVMQGVRALLTEMGKRTPHGGRSTKRAEKTEVKVVAKRPTVSSATVAGDAFDELEQFIVDAIAAMKLVQEHLPNVRKENERLRNMRDKLLKTLGVE